MVVQVVPGQVGEHGDGEAGAMAAALVEADGRDFHGAGDGAGSLVLGQQAVQGQGVGRGVGGFAQGVGKAVAEGADDGAGAAGAAQGLGNPLAVQVVLPLVPVTPTRASCSEGRP